MQSSTHPEPTSSWSQDLARGLTDPASVADRQERIQSYRIAESQRVSELNAALRTVRANLRNMDELVAVLHAATGAWAERGPVLDSQTSDAIKRLDALADYFEFGDEP